MSTIKGNQKRRRSSSKAQDSVAATTGEYKDPGQALLQAIEPLRPLLNMIKDAIVISDMQGTIMEVNDKALQISKCSRKDFIGRNAIEIIADKDRQAAIDSLMKQMEGGTPEMTECTFVATDGSEIEVDFSSSFINDSSGKPVGTITICRDITQRKRMEADLEKAAEKLQIIIESIGDMLFITDLDLNIVNVNEAALRALGYGSEDELVGKSATAPIAEKDRARITVYMGKALAGKESGHTTEYTLVSSDGKEFDVEANTEILHDCTGMTVGLIITARDISERKRMQEEIKKSAEKLNSVLESMSDGVIVLDIFGNITDANDTAVHMFEYSSKQELIGKNAMDTITERDRQKCADAISQSLETGKTPGVLEFAMATSTGREFDAELATSILHDSQGNLTGFVGVIRNITERKRMQAELEKSAEKLRTVIESIGDMLFITDMDLKLTNVNDAAARLLGYADREEMIGKNALDPVVAKDRARVAVDMAKALSGQDGSEIMEYTMLSAGGTELEVESNTEILRDCSGQTVGLIITTRDVTERRRMQEAVRASEEKLRTMFNSIKDGIVVTDTMGSIIEGNDAAFHMAGYDSLEEISGKNPVEFISERDRPSLVEELTKFLETGQAAEHLEYTMIKKDGAEFDIELNISALHDAGGNITGFIAVERDITERKRMQEELRKTAEKMRIMFDSIKDAVIVSDMSGAILEVNDAALQISGWTREEFAGKNAVEVLAEKDRAAAVESIMKQAEGELAMESAECTFILSEGKELEVDFTAALMRDAEGNPIGTVTVARDITERKRMQEELLKTAEKLRIMFETIGDMFILTDMELNIVNVNEAAARLLGYKHEEELAGKAVADFILEKTRDTAVKTMKKTLKTKEGSGTSTVEFKFVSAEGNEFDVEATTDLLRDCSGKPSGLIVTARDVTERKQMQEELRKTVDKLNILFESIADGIVVADMSGTIIETNEAAVRIAGFGSKDEVLGRNGLDFIAEEDRERVANDLAKALFEGSPVSISQYSINSADGRKIDLEVHTSMMRDGENNPVGFIVVERDITERKQMQEEIRNTAEKLRVIFEAIKDGVILIDTEGKVVDVNPGVLRLAGFDSKDELIGIDAMQFIPEAEREQVINEMMKSLAEGTAIENVEYKLLRKDGSTFDCEMSTAMLKDADGNPTGFVAVERDVTERKRMQEELRKTAEKLRIMFETIGDMFVLTDMELNIINANEAAARLLGYSSNVELAGKSVTELIAGKDRAAATKAMKKTLATKTGSGTSNLECTLITTSGKEFYVEATTDLLRDCSGMPSGLIITARDVTEGKRMIQALRDSEEKKRLIFEALRDGIMVVDLQGVVIETNPIAASMLGYTKGELIGKSTLDFVAKEDQEKAIENAIKLVSVGVADDYIDYSTLKLVKKDGGLTEVEHSTGLMRDSSGKPVAVIGISHDITERRRMEKELIESAEKLKSIFASIKDPVIISDMSGTILDVNDAALRVSGWPREKWVGTNALEVVHEKDRQAVVESLMKQMEEGPSDDLTECTFVVGDGRELEVDFSSSLIHDSSGQPIGTVTVARDITERKRAERAIRESEEKLRAMFDSVRDGILVIDLEGNFREFNEATMNMTGYSREELAGKSALDFIVEEDREKVVADLSQTLTDKHTQTLTSYRLLAKGNRGFDAELSSGMMLDSEGNPTALIGIMRDVTERKRMEEKLVKIKEDLERSNRELEQFAYVASHDLQEPLRMVSSYLKLLERRSKDKLDSEAQEFIDFAVDGSTRMAAMIQALLTYSRVGTRGKPFEPTESEDILRKALSNLQIAIEEKGAVVTHDPLPTIVADSTQMLQLFQNLIGNGLKFQDNKRPEVHVSVEDRGEDWVFSFRDNGIGIDPKYKERIFVIFERLHGKGEYKGTGIGLAVCKKIVERHGGRIWVDSTPGNGATFYFTMPKERKESDDAGK